MIRKGQARRVSDDVRQQNQFLDQLLDLAALDLSDQFLWELRPSPCLKLQHFPFANCWATVLSELEAWTHPGAIWGRANGIPLLPKQNSSEEICLQNPS